MTCHCRALRTYEAWTLARSCDCGEDPAGFVWNGSLCSHVTCGGQHGQQHPISALSSRSSQAWRSACHAQAHILGALTSDHTRIPGFWKLSHRRPASGLRCKAVSTISSSPLKASSWLASAEPLGLEGRRAMPCLVLVYAGEAQHSEEQRHSSSLLTTP